MYIIIEHNFDNMENHYPNSSNIVGYIEDEINVSKWIKNKMKGIKQHKGWDGNMYPYFDYMKVEKIL